MSSTKTQSTFEDAVELLQKAEQRIGELNRQIEAAKTAGEPIPPVAKPSTEDPRINGYDEKKVSAYYDYKHKKEVREIEIKTVCNRLEKPLARWQNIAGVTRGLITQSNRVEKTEQDIVEAQTSLRHTERKLSDRMADLASLRNNYQIAVELEDLAGAVEINNQLPVVEDFINHLESQRQQQQATLANLRRSAEGAKNEVESYYGRFRELDLSGLG